MGNKEDSTENAYYLDSAGVSENPRNGCVDQVAFWNRELTASEVTAQFNTLPQSGLPAYFNLSRWELRLPVNKANELEPTTDHAPLEISTGWLNSDFEYVDPVSSNPNPYTKKYVTV